MGRIKGVLCSMAIVFSLVGLTTAQDGAVTIAVQDKAVSLQATNAPLGTVLSELATKSGNQIVIHGQCDARISTSIANASFDDALMALLSGSAFTYVKRGPIYIVAEVDVDTLLYNHLIAGVLYGTSKACDSTGNADNIDRIPVPLKNTDMQTDQRYHLSHARASEVVAALPEKMVHSFISIDKESNSLLLHGTIKDIQRLKKAIAAIDTIRKQISMDVLLVEYRETQDKNTGLEFGAGGSSGTGITYPKLQISVSGQTARDVLTGRATLDQLNLLGSDFYAKLNLMISEGKASILAKPSISVVDGHEAVVSVLETQYFKVVTGVAENYTVRFQPINFGISLKIRPVITGENMITAEINPEISSSENTNGDGYPNVSSRSISSTVQMQDGKTLVLGGLIRQAESRWRWKVPLLGDIPFVGVLFHSKSKTFTRTNLCIYITPHILSSADSVSTTTIEEQFKSTKSQRLLEDLKNP